MLDRLHFPNAFYGHLTRWLCEVKKKTKKKRPPTGDPHRLPVHLNHFLDRSCGVWGRLTRDPQAHLTVYSTWAEPLRLCPDSLTELIFISSHLSSSVLGIPWNHVSQRICFKSAMGPIEAFIHGLKRGSETISRYLDLYMHRDYVSIKDY